MTVRESKQLRDPRFAGMPREARPGDAEEVRRLASASGLTPWASETYRKYALDGRGAFQVIEDATSGRLVAYCLLRGSLPELELLQVAVAPSVRRRQLGSRLLRACLDHVRREGFTECFLEVRSAATAAGALYRSLGFREIGRRAGYYSNPRDDAILMAKRLDAPRKARS